MLDQLATKTLPASNEAEAALLGAMLIDVSACDKALAILTGDSFFNENHRDLFGILRRIRDQRKPLDHVIIAEEVKKLDSYAYFPWALTIATMKQNGIPEGTGHYINIISGRERLRELIKVTEQIQCAAYSCDTDPDTLLDDSEARMLAIRDRGKQDKEPRLLRDIAKEQFYEQEDALTHGRPTGLRTGFPVLDEVLGPLLPGQCIIVGARPKMGKTAWALQVARHIAGTGEPVAVFSMEMEEHELSMRAMLQVMRYTKRDLEDFEACVNNSDIMTNYAEALDGVWNLPLYIDDRPGITVREMEQSIRRINRRAKQEWGKPIAFIVADYVQLFKSGERRNNSAEELGRTAYDFANMGKAVKCPTMLLTQLKRDCENRTPKRPLASDGLGSGMLEAAAHRFVTLYRPAPYGDSEIAAAGYADCGLSRTVCEVNVQLSRAGETGIVLQSFEGAHYRFRDLMPDEYATVRGRKVM
jgi:replicative DNA helicase